MNERNLAAVFIDFENFYYSLTNLYGFSYDEASGTAISIIGNSLDRLQDSLGEFITRQAFADWTELTEPKRELQKMGIRTIDFLSTAHKNSTDIELSLSVQEAVLTRDVLNTIVIFAGDTDYMPVALRTRERGKLLHFVGFRESLSGDLKKILGNGNYSYADTKSLSVDTERPEPLPESDSNDIVELNLYQRKAAEAAIQAFDSYKDQYGSVKLGGFLIDRLAKALPELDHLQRKRTFQDLEDLGLLNIQQKQSYPGGEFFAVFTINEENNIIKKIKKNAKNGEDILRKAVQNAKDDKGFVLGSRLGLELRKVDSKFSPSKFGCSSVSEFIEKYPQILSVTTRKQGEDIVYVVGG